MNKYKYEKICDCGDATSNYTIRGDFPVSFEQFVKTILNQETSFRVEFMDKDRWPSVFVEVEKQEGVWFITKQKPAKWYNDNRDKLMVTSCTANGGWGQMTYFMSLEESPAVLTPEPSPKRTVQVEIDNCRFCPNATLKFDTYSEEQIMYCQRERSLMMLREGWGDKEIPKWCPRLVKENENEK